MWKISNVRVIDAFQDKVQDVFIRDGVFTEPFEDPSLQVIDGSEKILFPGVIDPHVHFREPGFEYKEDLESGSRAAIAHGVTAFFDMPNTNPPTFTVEALEAKKALAEKKSWAHFGFFLGAAQKNAKEVKKAKHIPGVKMYLNTTTGNLKMDEEDLWEPFFSLPILVALHAEGETFFRAIEVWKRVGAVSHLHLCHASLKSEVEAVASLKSDPKYRDKVSMEVCPHHLFLTEKERRTFGAFCCMKPALATHEDLEALWRGVESGIIDFFASDHAPHTEEEKKSEKTYYGIPGVETLFPLLYDAFIARNYDLKLLAKMTSHATFKRFRVQYHSGLIRPGEIADAFLWDPLSTTTITPEFFYSKCKWSPFMGRTIKGSLLKTWVKGVLSFDAQKGFLERNAEALSFKPFF